MRIIEGLGEGVTFPAMLAFLARWAPPEERSRSGFIIALMIRNQIHNTRSHIISATFHFMRSLFYFFKPLSGLHLSHTLALLLGRSSRCHYQALLLWFSEYQVIYLMCLQDTFVVPLAGHGSSMYLELSVVFGRSFD